MRMTHLINKMMDKALWAGLLTLNFIVTGILYVAFSQRTVRKLRKKPATKTSLGIEIASGETL